MEKRILEMNLQLASIENFLRSPLKKLQELDFRPFYICVLPFFLFLLPAFLLPIVVIAHLLAPTSYRRLSARSTSS